MDFFQNGDSQFIIWTAIGILVLFGILVVSNKIRRVAAFGAHACLGIAAIFIINFALGDIIPAVGINVLTMSIAAFLGIPGVIMLYGLTFVL